MESRFNKVISWELILFIAGVRKYTVALKVNHNFQVVQIVYNKGWQPFQVKGYIQC